MRLAIEIWIALCYYLPVDSHKSLSAHAFREATMSLDLRPVQVRLTEEAYEALRVIAGINDQDLGEAARVLLTEALFGKSHSVRLLAERYVRAVKSDKVR